MFYKVSKSVELDTCTMLVGAIVIHNQLLFGRLYDPMFFCRFTRTIIL